MVSLKKGVTMCRNNCKFKVTDFIILCIIINSFFQTSSIAFALEYMEKNANKSRYLFRQNSMTTSPVLSYNTLDNTNNIEKINHFSYLRNALTIIKEYYVDRSTINNKDLLEHVVQYSKNELAKISFRRTPTHSILTINDNKINFQDSISDSDLIASFMLLSFEYDKSIKEKSSNQKQLQGSEFVLRGVMDYLDPHSILLSVDEYKELIEGTEGIFGGLGIIVSLQEDYVLTVIKPLPRSPAFRAGIKPGDKIVAIEGENTFGYSLDRLVSVMKGYPGSEIKLTILSQHALTTHEVTIKREIIIVDSVEKSLINYNNQNYLHLKIENFASRTSSEVKKHVKSAQSLLNPLAGIILDLRNNPGGLLDQAIKVGDLFLDKGIIVRTKGMTNKIEYAKQDDDICKNCPIIVLVGPETASASEIVSSALQDNKRALVIGQNTFGKSTVQTLFELQNKQAIKLTIARYYRSLGSSLQDIGVIPDLMVQELYMNEENSNLFGLYRYSREKFLSHKYSQINNQNSLLSPYNLYVVSNHSDSPDTFLVELAKKILNFSQKNWRQNNNNSHIVVDSYDVFHQNKSILHELRLHNEKSFQQLRKKYKLSWNENPAYKNSQTLTLQIIKSSENQKSKEPGETIDIKYKIKNTGTQNIERVSLFVRDMTYNLSIEEKLIGQIKSGRTTEGSITITIPNIRNDTKYESQLGLSVDGVSQLDTIQMYSIKTKKIPLVNLKTFVSLDHEKGGQVKGKLEPLEQADIIVKVKNKSKHKVKEISIKVINLSGDQIALENIEKKINSLNPGETKNISVHISGSNNLSSAKLPLGLFLNSNSIDKPIKKPIYIYTAPTSKPRRKKIR